MKEEDLLHILLDKKDSVYLGYKDFFRQNGLTLTMAEETARKLAKQAMQLGTGARGLRAEVDKLMQPLLYKMAAGELSKEDEVYV